MDNALSLIDDLITRYPDEPALAQLRETVETPSFDDLECIIEKIASTKSGKVELIRRGKSLIKKILGK